MSHSGVRSGSKIGSQRHPAEKTNKKGPKVESTRFNQDLVWHTQYRDKQWSRVNMTNGYNIPMK